MERWKEQKATVQLPVALAGRASANELSSLPPEASEQLENAVRLTGESIKMHVEQFRVRLPELSA